jgi:hypothetical protein
MGETAAADKTGGKDQIFIKVASGKKLNGKTILKTQSQNSSSGVLKVDSKQVTSNTFPRGYAPQRIHRLKAMIF